MASDKNPIHGDNGALRTSAAPAKVRLAIRLGLVLLLFLGVTTAWWLRSTKGRHPLAATESINRQTQAYLQLEAHEQAVDHGVWGAELEAEEFEDVWNRFWNALNRSNDSEKVVREFFQNPPVLPIDAIRESLPWGIQREVYRAERKPTADSDATRWENLWLRWHGEGWRLGRTAWHLTDHVQATPSSSPTSTVEFRIPAERPHPAQRICIEGQLRVDWDVTHHPPVPARITVTSLCLLSRAGPPAFSLVQSASLPVGDTRFSDPLLALDLDGDGHSDFLTLGSAQCWHNRPPDGSTPNVSRQLVPEKFGQVPRELVWAAALADLDGDGISDLILAGSEGLMVLSGKRSGGFVDGPPRVVWPASPKLRHPQVLAVGDVDGDGKLDVWIGQYKLPYLGGQFPTPFDDANDGFPSHLLRQESNGSFVDITRAAGLELKSRRRTYSASFIDLAGRGVLDFVQVSDFAGLDVYRNDGKGRFTDLTESLGAVRHGFGMAHAIADLNDDGFPDILLIGMDSPVAARLDKLGLDRPDTPMTASRRALMTFGNRLFLSDRHSPGNLGVDNSPRARLLARTGWSWGAAWADLHNDRSLELVVAAGHDTEANVQDYDRQFWLHDVYVGGSANDPVADLYFRSEAGRRRASQASYGGWQHNSVLVPTSVDGWLEGAWLLGLDFPADCRNLIVDDLDGDGRLDVVMMTEEAWPVRQRRLLVFHNDLDDTGHWIGFRLDAEQRNPVGARIVLEDTSGIQTRWILAGDGYRSQAAPAAHFGLGTNLVLRVTIHWPDGRQSHLSSPSRDQWHSMRP